MNINAKRIEELGGLVSLTMELNTPDFPEVDEKEITAYLFDGFGIAQCEGRYLFLTYPGVGNAMLDEQMRRTINQNRYGNRLPDDFKITVDDLAMCFAEVEEINHEEYVRQLMKGIFSNSKSLFKGTKMTPDKFREYNLRIIMAPCKHLFIFKEHNEFMKELDGKVYAVTDKNGNVICDILEADMVTFDDQDIISDGEIVSLDSIEFVRSQRVEIIFLNKPTKR
ncbi:hypothetical protein BN938_2486 [Mucinivorans hirudinis]|uniref:Uncharacterized protein n=1 Tax=Mucinivorans hirudinis TaxID=1433126 RepID=A0A060RA93_9BACT|nr:hypothetical protein BN938_2486 [Mucinivorans hirudinis]